MTSSDLRDRCRELREEFWRHVGVPGDTREHLGELDEPSLWPAGRSRYRRVSTAHAQVVATDGLSDPAPSGAAARRPGLGLELYIESTQLTGEDVAEAGWLVAVLEECAGAVAGAASSVVAALGAFDVLSVEVSGDGAPSEWVADGRLGVLLGVVLPGRAAGFDVDGARVRILSVTPLRPGELAVITAEGPQGRRRVAEALARSGWYSYADAERPAVL